MSASPPGSQDRLQHDRETLVLASQKGTASKLWSYSKLSGPGWLQGAVTLGGGSLAGSLYLGVLSGYSLLWLQPVAMILGIVMLSAIGYVTLSTGERPFVAMKKHVNPVLAWGWVVATLMANLVWCMPQFALGTAALRQNLFPQALSAEVMGSDFNAKLLCVVILFSVGSFIVWFYDSGGKGIRLFEIVLKMMVGVVVVCFFGVVIKMTFSENGLDWEHILSGFVPNFSRFNKPSQDFSSILSQTGKFRSFWEAIVVTDQRKVMITAVATAVGINMTFLLPYSMMRRGWDKNFRGLAIFDLSTGLFVPFILATSCVVIASASQFHSQPAVGFLGELDEHGKKIAPAANLVKPFHTLVDKRLKEELGEEGFKNLKSASLDKARKNIPKADRELAAMLVKRDAFNLAQSLKPLTGEVFSHDIFGIGVLGMAISTIIILMLINGFVVCEMLNLPAQGNVHRFGCLLAAISGATGSFFFSGDAKIWLAVPTSMFGMVLLPIAYFSFFFMMNSKSLLGENMPRGVKRFVWNTLMLVAALMAMFGSFWSMKSADKTAFGIHHSTFGFMGMSVFLLLAIIVHFRRRRSKEISSPLASANTQPRDD